LKEDQFWDARTYAEVSSNVQQEWGRDLIETRRWTGREIIMDAGAGSGNLTKMLAQRVPDGKVYAVDADPNMAKQAKSNLSSFRNVQVIQDSMDKVNLPTEVDVIFSNAALHWILNQEKAFSHFRQLLRTNGELLIECGGPGNIDRPLSVIFRMIKSDLFKEHFKDWKQSWHFPNPNDTEKLLLKKGFTEIQIKLLRRTSIFADRESFALFIRTVIMKPFLGYLPGAKKDQFLNIFLDEIQKDGKGWVLDYVRLRILAKKS
jgi:trans-aconitate 2-methyltransferase